MTNEELCERIREVAYSACGPSGDVGTVEDAQSDIRALIAATLTEAALRVRGVKPAVGGGYRTRDRCEQAIHELRKALEAPKERTP